MSSIKNIASDSEVSSECEQNGSAGNKDMMFKLLQGRGKKILVPARSAAQITKLTKDLGFKSEGETIQWLLKKTETNIMKEISTGTTSGALKVPVEKYYCQGVKDDGVSKTSGLAPVGPSPMFVPGGGFCMMSPSGQRVWPVPLALINGVNMRKEGPHDAVSVEKPTNGGDGDGDGDGGKECDEIELLWKYVKSPADGY